MGKKVINAKEIIFNVSEGDDINHEFSLSFIDEKVIICGEYSVISTLTNKEYDVISEEALNIFTDDFKR